MVTTHAHCGYVSAVVPHEATEGTEVYIVQLHAAATSRFNSSVASPTWSMTERSKFLFVTLLWRVPLLRGAMFPPRFRYAPEMGYIAHLLSLRPVVY